MFEPLPNIEYDEQTRRINRRMKVIGGTSFAVLLVAGSHRDHRQHRLDAADEVTLRQ